MAKVEKLNSSWGTRNIFSYLEEGGGLIRLHHSAVAHAQGGGLAAFRASHADGPVSVEGHIGAAKDGRTRCHDTLLGEGKASGISIRTA